MATFAPPPPDFWEDDLEMPVEQALRRVSGDAFRREWIGKLTGRQLEVLCRSLGFDATRIKEKRAALGACNGELVPFCLTDQFARHKGKFAIADLAATVLPADIVDICRCKDEDEFDTRALLYAMLFADPEHLKTLFHLDKIHKSGFARMTLKKKPRKPKAGFEEFLTIDRVTKVVAAFDKKQRDGRQSQVKNVVRHHHHHLVFIRRPERQLCIMQAGKIQHGHRAEWIILDFADSAKRVNISSDSNEVPLRIANEIASAYFAKPVEYDNECEITYEKQIQNLLNRLKAGNCDGMQLVELDVHGTPLHGVDMRLRNEDPDLVRRAIASLERDHGHFTANLDQIAHVKIVYLDKRVEIKFEPLDVTEEQYVVRYMDHRLNAALRRRFEDFMRDTHGIPVLSTEKRFARGASACPPAA